MRELSASVSWLVASGLLISASGARAGEGIVTEMDGTTDIESDVPCAGLAPCGVKGDAGG